MLDLIAAVAALLVTALGAYITTESLGDSFASAADEATALFGVLLATAGVVFLCVAAVRLSWNFT